MSRPRSPSRSERQNYCSMGERPPGNLLRFNGEDYSVTHGSDIFPLTALDENCSDTHPDNARPTILPHLETVLSRIAAFDLPISLRRA